jgi:hypothetical protein
LFDKLQSFVLLEQRGWAMNVTGIRHIHLLVAEHDLWGSKTGHRGLTCVFACDVEVAAGSIPGL